MTKNQRARRIAELNRYAQSVLDTIEASGFEYTGLGVQGITFRFSSRGHYSSGRTNGAGFHTITVGTDSTDALHVIRHELVHAVRGCLNHSTTFFRTLYMVTKNHDADVLPYTIKRESLYKVRNASKAAKPFGGIPANMYMPAHYTAEEKRAKRQAKVDRRNVKADKAMAWVEKHLQPGFVDGSGKTIERTAGHFRAGMVAVYYTDNSHRYLSLNDF
jgi:hypothetical protein